MKNENRILGLSTLGNFLNDFLNKDVDNFNESEKEFEEILRKSEIENPWFTNKNLRFCLKNWAKILKTDLIENWLKNYQFGNSPKNVGLILAGNIPIVGFHDVICVLLSNHIPIIKLSSKDRLLIPFLLKKWNEFSGGNLSYQLVEKIENIHAVIATGSNNTASYLEYYFKDYYSIIRKNRTSVTVLRGDETNEELQQLAVDIFTYFGLGCRNVTKIYIPEDFKLDRLFENFLAFQDVVNHHKYANNYDYNKAIYLLNLDLFWDNNFVMMKDDDRLFPPISVLYFSRYQDLSQVKSILRNEEKNIQCVVAKPELGIENSIYFGEAQQPSLDTYADNVDTMKFLSVI